MERAVAMDPEKKEYADRLKKFKADLKKPEKTPKKPDEGAAPPQPTKKKKKNQ